MRAELRDIIRTQKHIGGWEEPSPMDLGTLGKGKCRHCGRAGHTETLLVEGQRKGWKGRQGDRQRQIIRKM
eukprot:5200272-Amphidinium_carterae.1